MGLAECQIINKDIQNITVLLEFNNIIDSIIIFTFTFNYGCRGEQLFLLGRSALLINIKLKKLNKLGGQL